MIASNKDKYAEVLTPPHLVFSMIQDAAHLCGGYEFFDVSCIFEIGAGKGVFLESLIDKYEHSFPNTSYIMSEINDEHKNTLTNLSLTIQKRDKLNIFPSVIMGDLFKTPTIKQDFFNSVDIVWGNLPFHNGGKSFVPGLGKGNGHGKGNSGIVTIWPSMIFYAFDVLLKPGGYFFAIIPCIWLKEDKAGIYTLFTKTHRLIFLKIFDCKQANKLFHYNCQTPICYVMVQKSTSNTSISSCNFKLFDSQCNQYTDFTLLPNYCIPTNHVNLFKKRIKSIVTNLETNSCYDMVKRTSFMKKSVMKETIQTFNKQNLSLVGKLQDAKYEHNQLYKVITGASIIRNSNEPDSMILHGVVSKEYGAYYGIPKLILPHKRLLRFFKDYDGTYSCYGRDMHVFLFDSVENAKHQIDSLASYLSNDSIRNIIESGFCIRMNFIEKYPFKYINYPL